VPRKYRYPQLTAKKNGDYIDLYVDGEWIADIRLIGKNKIQFFTGELDVVARTGGTSSAYVIIGGPELVEIRRSPVYDEAVRKAVLKKLSGEVDE